MKGFPLLVASLVVLIHFSEARLCRVVVSDLSVMHKTPAAVAPTGTSNRVLSLPRGGAFSILGLTVSANQLARVYVGFTEINGVAMAVLPTVAANLYGSAFDDSKESLLATLLLERQGDAVLGTAILLQLSTYTNMPIANSVAWSTVPYVLSLVKFIATGQVDTLGFDNRVAVAMLLTIVLPALNIVVRGWNPSFLANALATAIALYGVVGSVSPGLGASVEGLDIVSSSPGWIGACWSLASLCVLQQAILMFRVLSLGPEDATIQNTVGFAALLNVVLSAYVAFMSGIPESVEIPKIGFVVWIAVGLVVGLGIRHQG